MNTTDIRMINNAAEAARHARQCLDDMQSLTTKNQQLMGANKKFEVNIQKINCAWKRQEAENVSLKESIQDLSADREASSKTHELQIQELIKASENLRKEVESFRNLSEVKDD